MVKHKGIRTARAKILSTIWVCEECGLKVYCGQLHTRPTHICNCGKNAWRRTDEKKKE